MVPKTTFCVNDEVVVRKCSVEETKIGHGDIAILRYVPASLGPQAEDLTVVQRVVQRPDHLWDNILDVPVKT